MTSETIFALSSGTVPSGVAVVRISGKGATTALIELGGSIPEERIATKRTIRGRDGLPIDSAIVLYFKAPRSFTGEDSVEFQLHGSPAVVSAVMRRLSELDGFRHAQPGEFTRRAFENAKLDLAAAEALGDLIASETEAQRRLAMRGLGTEMRLACDGWRDRLLHARAMIEAELDFSDEEDVPGSISEAVWIDVAALVEEIRAYQLASERAGKVRDGIMVAIAGAPNAGKSSLLNALAGRDAAIVSELPGTTRDVIEVKLDLGGYLVVLADTAGIRSSDDRIEKIGIERARMAVEQADIVLSLAEPGSAFVTGEEKDRRSIRVRTKTDIGHAGPAGAGSLTVDQDGLGISVVTGEGLIQLEQRLAYEIRSALGDLSSVLPVRERHAELLERAQQALYSALSDNQMPLELRAEHLRHAADEIGRITGAISTEDLLDVIFRQFCIGK